MKRGESRDCSAWNVELDDDVVLRSAQASTRAQPPNSNFIRNLLDTVEDCYQRLLLPATESATLQRLKEQADEEAIQVFAQNLRDLLLAAPAGLV